MVNLSRIKSVQIREEVGRLNIYLESLLTGKIGYTLNKLMGFKESLIKTVKEVTDRIVKENRKKVKKMGVETKDYDVFIDPIFKSLIGQLDRRLQRAFALAANSVERHLKITPSRPGFWGLKALGTLVKRKVVVKGLNKIEGFNRLRGEKKIFSMNLISYIISLLTVYQEDVERELNKGIAFARKTDLVYVSMHPCWLGVRAKEICNRWRGSIISLTGAIPGFPTLRDAIRPIEIEGHLQKLFHPNCTHSLHNLSQEQIDVILRQRIKNMFDLFKRFPKLKEKMF